MAHRRVAVRLCRWRRLRYARAVSFEVVGEGFIATVSRAWEGPWDGLREHLDGLTGGYGLRAVVFDLRSPGDGPQGVDHDWLARFPVPCVAALGGDVAGVAADFAFACDIRVSGPELRLGMGGGGGGRLLTLLGGQDAGPVPPDGSTFSADQALAAGLVTAVVPEPLIEAKRIAAIIATRGPIATRFAKEAIWRGIELSLEAALRFETDLTLLLQTTNDRAEGVAAFLHKRQPTFTGS